MKFNVTDSLKGSMSIMQLLSPCGIIEIQIELGSVVQEGYYFQLFDDEFNFQLLYHNGVFKLIRNCFTVEFEGCKGKPEGIYHTVVFSWAPTWLFAGGNGDKRRIETPPTSVPISIIQHARKQNLLPNASFPSVEKLRQKILDCLYSIQNKIDESNSQDMFWDTIKNQKGHFISKTPKKEVDVQSIIHSLLVDQMMVNSIEVIPEYKNGRGSLDFCLIAQVDDVGLSKFAIEFKRAHSTRLTHGLETQLPIYMEAIKSTYGIYGVFWFKGDTFEQPSKFKNIDNLEISLNILKNNSITPAHENINIIMFDFSPKKTASVSSCMHYA